MDEDQHMEVNAVMEIRVAAFVDDELALIYQLLFQPIDSALIAFYFFLLTYLIRNIYMIEETRK
jgi:hypothetical protein